MSQAAISAAPASQSVARAVEAVATGVGLAAGLARHLGVGVNVVDVGLAVPDPAVPGPAAQPARPAGSISSDALTEDELAAAMQAGRDRADAAVDSGADLLIGVRPAGSGYTPAAAITAALTAMEPVEATSRGSASTTTLDPRRPSRCPVPDLPAGAGTP